MFLPTQTSNKHSSQALFCKYLISCGKYFQAQREALGQPNYHLIITFDGPSIHQKLPEAVVEELQTYNTKLFEKKHYSSTLVQGTDVLGVWRSIKAASRRISRDCDCVLEQTLFWTTVLKELREYSSEAHMATLGWSHDRRFLQSELHRFFL